MDKMIRLGRFLELLRHWLLLRAVPSIPADLSKIPELTDRLEKINGDLTGFSSRNSISIIVLNRNGARHLKNLFQSFSIHNSHKFFEFIVVDHASTDNSLAVIKDFEAELQIKVIKEITNKSFSHSNNKAVRLSKYENLLFINNDIVIKEDVIPGILSHLKNPEVGVVGIDLYYPGEGMECRTLQHAGVRFKEDPRHQFFRPYNVKRPGMEKIENVPAVTGAFLACRKKDFIKAGGFFEGYFYGYEDVDLCLSVTKFTKKKCIIDHNLFAIHDESATQKKDSSRSIKKRRLNNIETLISRHGYGLKRAILQDIYKAKTFWSQTRPVIGFAIADDALEAAGENRFSAPEFAESIQRELGFECRILARKPESSDWYNVGGLDILLVMADGYDLTKIRNARPSLIRMAWVRSPFEGWVSKSWFSGYDVYLCSSNKAADWIHMVAGCEVHILSEQASMERLEGFGRVLGNYRSEKYRISIKIGLPDYKFIKQWADYYYALGLQNQFKKLGHSVRIDILPEWYRSESFGDDVVIVLRGLSKYKSSGSHINLMWNISNDEKIGADEYEGYDHIFIASEKNANNLKAELATPVSALLQCAEPGGRMLRYGGFIAGLKARLAMMKCPETSADPAQGMEMVRIQNHDFAHRAGEILRIVKECDAKKCIGF